MILTIMCPTNNTPPYYYYQNIYSSPSMSREAINKYYKKKELIAINDVSELNEYVITIGDIIYNDDIDTYYFYTPELIEIIY